MRRALGILAVVAMTLGLMATTTENEIQEQPTISCDDCSHDKEIREAVACDDCSHDKEIREA